MAGRWMAVMVGLLALGACAQTGTTGVGAASDRLLARSFADTPLRQGAIAIFASEPGGPTSYRLSPCGNGAACVGGPGGTMGSVTRTADWTVVRGLHGRTFWLGQGGTGFVERAGTYLPLSWAPRAEGTGEGDAPSIETPYRHG
ncbi:hypothetical protein [Rubellimicrobium aerolatum]|uniref:Uncharacterized protein n=1 Tax=Rubellimicrobium aerolatum TaxID=490979 RepID=A0ABW0SGH2_9RHOB|nr:hypothetical protein [Rubellimicrobium aerolatum]MBP1806654.1 hypothetical protein [Rubellimicrobium aerolatum]